MATFERTRSGIRASGLNSGTLLTSIGREEDRDNEAGEADHGQNAHGDPIGLMP
jgi:hypothetical protein